MSEKKMTVLEELRMAVKLVLALHKTAPENEVPGFTVLLDPQAKKQLEAALARVPYKSVKVLETIEAHFREIERTRYETGACWRDEVGRRSDLCARFLAMLRNIKDVYEAQKE